jgi:hypothetical protein
MESRILATARELAFPRYPGTDGDRQAIELVTRWFRNTGLETEVEWFSYDIAPAFRALRTMLVVTAGLVALAGVLAIRAPGIAILCLVVALAAPAFFLAWAPWLERIYRGEGATRTANVMARRAVSEPRLTLILLAHHDSKSQSLSLPFRAVFTLTAIVGALGLLLYLAIVGLMGSAVGAAGLALGTLAAVCLLALATMRNGNDSPGGVDNAGSVGLLVELAHQLPAVVPQDVELIFLSPGAEEDHMVGAMRWLDAHMSELEGRPVWAINLDGVGIPGRVTLLERYGLGTKFSDHLSQVTRTAAAELDMRVRGILIPPAMGVDAIPFVHRGVPCLTLTSGSLGAASLSVHSKNDRFEHLDGAVLEQVAQLVKATAVVLTLADQKK